MIVEGISYSKIKAEYVGDGISYRRRSRMMDERKTLQK